jgi:hypothetical protein
MLWTVYLTYLGSPATQLEELSAQSAAVKAPAAVHSSRLKLSTANGVFSPRILLNPLPFMAELYNVSVTGIARLELKSDRVVLIILQFSICIAKGLISRPLTPPSAFTC